jgi:hypothetical protein
MRKGKGCGADKEVRVGMEVSELVLDPNASAVGPFSDGVAGSNLAAKLEGGVQEPVQVSRVVRTEGDAVILLRAIVRGESGLCPEDGDVCFFGCGWIRLCGQSSRSHKKK